MAPKKNPAAVALGQLRTAKLSPEAPSASARVAAQAKWASLSDHEKRTFMAKVRAGRKSAKGASKRARRS